MKLTGIFLIAALAFTGCHHSFFDPDLVPPAAPRGLYTETGDNFVELFWDENREPDVAGYNIYVGTNYEGRYDLIGSSSEPYFVDRDAVNGVTYYYAVTAYDYSGNESDLSRDMAYDIPRPEGYNVVLMDAWASPGVSGYDFSDYQVVSWDDDYTDVYYEYYNGEYYMVVRTDSDIQDVGPTGSILDVKIAPASGWSATHDVTLRVGHTYVVWTWDDHYAKFRVSALSPTRVVFDWAYQLQPSNPMMKRPAGERKPADVSLSDRQRGSK